MRVWEVMDRQVGPVSPDATIADIIQSLASAESRGLLVADQDRRLLGIVTQEAVQRAAAGVSGEAWEEAARTIQVAEIMSRNPVTVGPQTPVYRAIGLLVGFQLQRIAVIENERCQGILSSEAVLARYASDLETAESTGDRKPVTIMQTLDIDVEAPNRILVASRNPNVGPAIVEPLERQGFAVERAETVEEYSNLRGLLVPDLVVLDPELNPPAEMSRLSGDCPVLTLGDDTWRDDGKALVAMVQQSLCVLMDAREPPPKDPRVLIADDDHVVRRILCHQLERAGYKVTEARNGREALEQLEDHQFIFIILDIHMPFRSGLEVLALLKQVGDATPRIVLSASGNDDTVLEALDLGADDFLRKPFNPAIVLRKMERLRRRS